MGISVYPNKPKIPKETVIDTGLDVNNTATVTTSLNVSGMEQIGLHMKEASGNHAAAIWRLYCSPDNTNWFKTDQVSTAQTKLINKAESFDARGTQWVRSQVDTASTVAATEDTTIVA